MINKISYSVLKAYYNAKAKVEKLKNEEAGMETIEAVILIAIAVVVAALVLNFLTGSDGNGGIVKQLFDKIGGKINNMFK